jgi:hypothetical protein
MYTHQTARKAAAIAALALLPLGVTFASEKTTTPQAQIPFVNYGGINDWQADHDKGLWIQDNHRKWYYASLMGPCSGLGFATSVGFDTAPFGTFDRFSSVIVPGWGRCIVQTLTSSDGPPAKQTKQKTG